MNTVHQPPDSTTDPQAATPYFLRCVQLDKAVELEKARRGLLAA